MGKGYRQQLPDRDPQETEEWIDSTTVALLRNRRGCDSYRHLLCRSGIYGCQPSAGSSTRMWYIRR